MPHPHALRRAFLRIGAVFAIVASGVTSASAQTPSATASPALSPAPEVSPSAMTAPTASSDSAAPSPAAATSSGDATPSAKAMKMSPGPSSTPASEMVPPAAAPTAEASTLPAATFGEPPSGAVPILFNDQHVYTKPDRLKHRRVLAALVRGNTILVPLRSMFEQMGARVSYSENSRTVDVSKPGTDIQLTVGKRSVTINGQETPLDVPAEIYRGAIVVPVRVISEGMGAYVQWVPDRHVVVIRYEAAVTAPPSSPPLATPLPTASAAPIATPAPAAKAPYLERFVGGDFIISPKVYNEISPGNEGRGSYDINGDIEFFFLGPQWEIGADYRHVRYDHNSNLGFVPCTTAPGVAPCNTVVGGDPVYLAGPCVFGTGDQGCVTIPGFSNVAALNGLGQAYVPSFTAGENALNAHFGLKVADPHVYVEVAYYRKSYDYLGYPTIGGIGAGLDKLPDLDKFFSLYGSAWYFPDVTGTYHYATSTLLGPLSGAPVRFGYNIITYDGGGAFSFGRDKGAYVRAGFRGERANGKTNAPSSTSVAAPYVGLGLHF